MKTHIMYTDNKTHIMFPDITSKPRWESTTRTTPCPTCTHRWRAPATATRTSTPCPCWHGRSRWPKPLRTPPPAASWCSGRPCSTSQCCSSRALPGPTRAGCSPGGAGGSTPPRPLSWTERTWPTLQRRSSSWRPTMQACWPSAHTCRCSTPWPTYWARRLCAASSSQSCLAWDTTAWPSTLQTSAQTSGSCR
ncbi:hypothetical protein B484DRAFT_86175 [Ochromonadaceae sp. CCMP2298]|nr:hypothetical protein B484DRAFT_86175 [Ochromonadaceae sp. CCMP2298]